MFPGSVLLVIQFPSERRTLFMRVHLVFAALVINATAVAAAELQEVASFPDQQVTGVGVSTKSGRVFVNFPYWSDQHSMSVAELSLIHISEPTRLLSISY